jgi:hypothetical protein
LQLGIDVLVEFGEVDLERSCDPPVFLRSFYDRILRVFSPANCLDWLDYKYRRL